MPTSSSAPALLVVICNLTLGIGQSTRRVGALSSLDGAAAAACIRYVLAHNMCGLQQYYRGIDGE